MTAQESGEIIFYFGLAGAFMSLVYFFGSYTNPHPTSVDFVNVVFAPFGFFGSLIVAILGKIFSIKNK
jgi:hypothetical protein